MDLAVLGEDIYLKMLLYGDAGSGKTTLAASAHLIPEMQPVLYATAEGGLITLKKPEHEGVYDDMDVYELTDQTQDSNAVLAKVEALYDYVQKHKYRTVVIDTLSEIQRYGLMFVSKNKGDWKGIYRNPQQITLPQYGMNKMQTDTLIRAFRDLPMHVIMTSHAKRAHLDTDGHDYVVPNLTGQQWIDTLATFDIVWFLSTRAAFANLNEISPEEGGVAYRILTKSWDNVKAKDRLFTLPAIFDVTGKKLADIVLAG